MNPEEKTNNGSTVGAQIPDRLFQIINLYKTTYGTSKSQIIRDSLLLWIEQNGVDIEEVITDLKKKYQAEWLRLKSYRDEAHKEGAPIPATKDEFINDRSNNLKNKNISDSIIDRIFEDF